MLSILIAPLVVAQTPTLAIAGTRKVQGIRAISLAASPTGARLAVGIEGGGIKIVDAVTGATLKQLTAHPQDAKALAWSPNGQILASGDESARIRFYDTKTWTFREIRPHTKAIQTLSFNAAGTMLASTSADDTIKLWNMSSLAKPVLDYKGKGANLYGGKFVGKTNDFACATLTDTALVVSPKGEVKKKLTTANNLSGSNDITVNSVASRAVTAGRDNAAAVFDLKTGYRIAYLRGHGDWLTNVQFSPNGKWVATSSSDGTVRVYDMKTAKTVVTLETQLGVGSPVVFSSDGRYLSTIDAFNNLQVSKLNMSVAGGKVAEAEPKTTVTKKKTPAKKTSRKKGRG
jgi:WD40 repeat protein